MRLRLKNETCPKRNEAGARVELTSLFNLFLHPCARQWFAPNVVVKLMKENWACHARLATRRFPFHLMPLPSRAVPSQTNAASVNSEKNGCLCKKMLERLHSKEKKLPVRSICCHSNSTNAGLWKRLIVALPAQSIFRSSNLPNSAWTVIRVGIEFSILGSTRLPIVFTLVLLASGSRACIKLIYLTSCVEWKFQSPLRKTVVTCCWICFAGNFNILGDEVQRKSNDAVKYGNENLQK